MGDALEKFRELRDQLDNGRREKTEVRKEIVDQLQHGSMTQSELARTIGCSPNTVKRHAEKLIENDVVRREQSGYAYRYWLVDGEKRPNIDDLVKTVAVSDCGQGEPFNVRLPMDLGPYIDHNAEATVYTDEDNETAVVEIPLRSGTPSENG